MTSRTRPIPGLVGDEAGASILETIVGLGLVAVVAAAFAQIHLADNKAAKRHKLTSTRSRLASVLTLEAGLKGSLRNSIRDLDLQPAHIRSVNQKLADCILSGGGNDCTTGQLIDFYLISPEIDDEGRMGGVISGVSRANNPASSVERPLILDYDGRPAPEGVVELDPEKYPFRIYTRFRPACPRPNLYNGSQFIPNGLNAQAVCDAAASIEVIVSIDSQAHGESQPLHTETSVLVKNIDIEGG